MEDDFEVVVDTSPACEADEAFDTWLASKGLTREDIADDVRVDTFHTRRGVERRYLVRRTRLEGRSATRTLRVAQQPA